jgi:hypothetical protein
MTQLQLLSRLPPELIQNPLHGYLGLQDLGRLASTSEEQRNLVYTNDSSDMPAIRGIPGSYHGYICSYKHFVDHNRWLREVSVYIQAYESGPMIRRHIIRLTQYPAAALVTCSIFSAGILDGRESHHAQARRFTNSVPAIGMATPLVLTLVDSDGAQRLPQKVSVLISLVYFCMGTYLLERNESLANIPDSLLGPAIMAHSFFSACDFANTSRAIEHFCGHVYGSVRRLQFQASETVLGKRIRNIVKATITFPRWFPRFYLDNLNG